MDFEHYARRYMGINFMPDWRYIEAAQKMQHWQGQQQRGTAIEVSTVVPMLDRPLTQSPAWMYDLKATGSDDDGRPYLWWTATNQILATGFNDGLVDWTAPSGDPGYDR